MDHISTWTNEDVLKWSCQVVRLSQSTLDGLREHNIDGMMLVNWSEDKLQTALGLRNVSNNNNDWKEIQYLRFQNNMLDLSTAVDLNREMIEEVESSGYPPVDKKSNKWLTILNLRAASKSKISIHNFTMTSILRGNSKHCSIDNGHNVIPIINTLLNYLEDLIEDMQELLLR
jgi:SAM domain (Sterile alpha motif)